MATHITHARRGFASRLATMAIPVLLGVTTLVGAPAGASSLTVTFSVTSVSFGSLTTGTTLLSQAVVTNTTSSTLYLKAATVHGGDLGQFDLSSTGCAAALAPSASCSLDVTFAPTSAGLKSTSLGVTLAAKGTGGQFVAEATVQGSLSGTGVLPTFSLSNAAAGSVKVGTLAIAQSVLTNTSSVPLIVHNWSLQNAAHNAFSLASGTCPTPVAPGQSCDFVFEFAPKVQGDASATFTVKMLVVGASSQELVTEQASVTGTGTASGSAGSPVSVSSDNLGSVEVGTSVTGSVALTNTSTGTVQFLGASVHGLALKDFKITGNTCSAVLASGASCTIGLSFTPSLPNLRNATLGVEAKVTNGSSHHVVTAVASLSGTGLRPTISIVAPDFGSVTIGSSTSAQVVLTNTSLATLRYDKSTLIGPHLPSWKIVSTTCHGDLAPAASCQVELSFAPHSQGDLSTAIAAMFFIHTVHHNVAVGGQTSVSGAGTEPTFSVTPPSFTTVAKGASSSSDAVITNTSNVALLYSSSQIFGTNPNDFHVTGTTCASQIAPNSTCNVNLVFTAHQTGAGSRTASLKIFLQIAGISPSSMVSNTVALTGQES